MKNPFDYFDVIYCINLDHRVDRWNRITEIFDNLEISDRVIRIPGIVATTSDNKKLNALNGSRESHFLCLKNSIDNGYNNCFIFEDDAQPFLDILSIKNILSKALLSLPLSWGMFFLGGNTHYSNVKIITPSLAKTDYFYSNQSYAVNKNVMEYTLLNLHKAENIGADDFFVENVMEHFENYVTIPLLFGQYPNHSDIRDSYIDYNRMFLDTYNNALTNYNTKQIFARRIFYSSNKKPRSANPDYIAK